MGLLYRRPSSGVTDLFGLWAAAWPAMFLTAELCLDLRREYQLLWTHKIFWACSHAPGDPSHDFPRPHSHYAAFAPGASKFSARAFTHQKLSSAVVKSMRMNSSVGLPIAESIALATSAGTWTLLLRGSRRCSQRRWFSCITHELLYLYSGIRLKRTALKTVALAIGLYSI